ncbi:MAG TPA: prephenate dehydrogenase/arogenate dehydrogenase family protein [Bryobacteraceae bacterium]|nr:prephenate dehydrogenase/arogenate dehydrogenase family protein [Bryobacteraceae bacterium]
MRCLAIVGVGLIGGSFALALRKAGYRGQVLGVSSAPTLEQALQMGVIDEGVELERAAKQADVVFLSQPILRIFDTLDVLDGSLNPTALVTDAGSTKSEIVARARKKLTQAQFLGGHPMAGKETRGVASADPDLFCGRTWVLTPLAATDLETAAAREFAGWIEKIGANPVVLSPADHDRIVAFTSHLPQLLSTALAATLAGVPGAPQAAGPAALDLTRLALSPYDVWSDIFTTNSGPVGEALSAYIDALDGLRRELASPTLRHWFEQAAAAARELRERPSKL